MKKIINIKKVCCFNHFSEEVVSYLFRIIHFIFGKNTQHLEDKIDLMVYKLYELTYDEVRIVDPEFWMSKKGVQTI